MPSSSYSNLLMPSLSSFNTEIINESKNLRMKNVIIQQNTSFFALLVIFFESTFVIDSFYFKGNLQKIRNKYLDIFFTDCIC